MKTIESEQLHFSKDAIEILSLLPSGLTEEYLEKACHVLGRTKQEMAVHDLLDALNQMNDYFIHGKELTDEELNDMLNYSINAIKKATK